MAIAWVSSGTVGIGSTSVTPGLPASLATGDGVLIQVVTKPDTATINTPAGWTLVADIAGGGGTTGNQIGPTRQAWFFREKDAGWSTMPAISITNGNSSASIASRYTKGSGNVWQSSAATAAWGTGATTTALNVQMGADPGITSGDFMVVGVSNMNDAVAWSGQGISATGATFASVTERSDVVETTTGNDVGGMYFTAAVTAGTASVAPTITGTAAVAGRGTVVTIRLRESTPTTEAASGSGSLSLSGVAATSGGGGGSGTVGFIDSTVAESAAATALTVTKPTGVVDGTVLVASVNESSGAKPTTVPSGWTEHATVSGSTLVTTTMYYKVVSSAAGEPADYTWSGWTSGRCTAAIAAFSGVDNTNPMDVTASTIANNSGTTLSPAAITTTLDNAMLVATAGQDSSSGSITNPAGWTTDETNTASVGRQFMLAHNLQATAGSTGSLTWTFSGTLWHTVILTALRPAPAGGGGGGVGGAAVATGSLSLSGTASPPGQTPASGTGALSLSGTAAANAGLPTPQNLQATAVSQTQVNLTWDAVTGATGYDIERDSVVIVTDHPTNSYSDTGRTAATTYTYRVRAVG